MPISKAKAKAQIDLHTAARTNNVELLRDAVNKGADVSYCCHSSFDEFTPLTLAVDNSSWDVVNVLFDEYRVKENEFEKTSVEFCPYYHGMTNINTPIDILKKLLSIVPNINAYYYSEYGDTLLTRAIKIGINSKRPVIVALLLEVDDIKIRDYDITWACQRGGEAILKLLLNKKKPVFRVDLLIRAIDSENTEIVKIILNYAPDQLSRESALDESRSHFNKKYDYTELMFLIAIGERPSSENAKKALSSCDISYHGREDHCALYLAVKVGSIEWVNELIKKGVEIGNCKANAYLSTDTPLRVAIKLKQVDIILMLIKADVNISHDVDAILELGKNIKDKRLIKVALNYAKSHKQNKKLIQQLFYLIQYEEAYHSDFELIAQIVPLAETLQNWDEGDKVDLRSFNTRLNIEKQITKIQSIIQSLRNDSIKLLSFGNENKANALQFALDRAIENGLASYNSKDDFLNYKANAKLFSINDILCVTSYVFSNYSIFSTWRRDFQSNWQQQLSKSAPDVTNRESGPHL